MNARRGSWTYLFAVGLGCVVGAGGALAWLGTRDSATTKSPGNPPNGSRFPTSFEIPIHAKVSLVPDETYPEDATEVTWGEVEKRVAKPYPYPSRYQFKHRDFFSRCVPLWEPLLKPYFGKPGIHYLEIGVAEGRSLLWTAENVCTDETSRLTGIDINLPPELAANVKASPAAERIQLIIGPSQVELRKLAPESYDIIYVDGDHLPGPVLEDLILSWRLLKPSGLMILDDYGMYVDRPQLTIISGATNAFLAFFDQHFDVLHVGYQVVLRKRVPDPPAPK